ncbi:MAG: iron-sulfur cluster assembly protein [Desulfurococcales archaeon]|nr:iron-sulfur cluster assembly protein [Desulfurococcales archaeon]
MALTVKEKEELRKNIIEVLKEVYDPEIPIDVWNLGLIYDIDIDDEGNVHILMTMTAIGCPVAGLIVHYVEEALKDGIAELRDKNVEIEITWDPPWTPDRVTPEGRELLKAMFGYDVVEEWKKRMEQQPTTA